MMKKIFSLSLLLLTLQIIFGQVYQTKIKTGSESGLHKIELSPQIRSAMQNNAAFIRIFDSKNKEVPYVVFKKEGNNSSVEHFTILSRNKLPNALTSVVISNENSVKLDQLTLKIASTEVDKKYSISGSNDNVEWFGLVNNQIITNLNEVGKTSVVRNFTFPMNNYKYLKFDFIDKNSLPINVLEASLEKNAKIKNAKIELAGFTQLISNDKSTHQTKIEIAFKEPQVINGLRFDVTAPNYYTRNASLMIVPDSVPNKQKNAHPKTISYFTFNSKTNNEFEIPEFFAKKLIIGIENADNPELEIKDIQIFQNPLSIIADLKANEPYTLKINTSWQTPNYDLAQSGINFNQNYPVATTSSLQTITQNETESFWQNPLFMWICIVLAVIIIGYFTVVMIRDMNKAN